MASPSALDERCVAHPGRPAVDRCPLCDRPRCGADTTGRGCAVCHGRTMPTEPPQPGVLEVLVRAALAAHAVALVAGVVLSEYPGAPFFQFAAPLVGGAAVGAAATAAAGEPKGPVRQRIRGLSAVYAVLATAFGFMLEGTYGVFELDHEVFVPYAVAGAAAWLWTRPPKPRVRASEGE